MSSPSCYFPYFLISVTNPPIHIHWKGVSINFYQPFLIIELQTPLFNGRLNLLLEHPALIGVMCGGVVPLVSLLVL
jgi:hypothetical protein